MILKLVLKLKRCHVNIGFIVLVSYPGWSFIVLALFAGLNCEWMNLSKTLMSQGITEIKGMMKLLDMPMPMLKEIVKGEVQVGVEDSHFHGLSMDYFLHHLLVPMQMEMVLNQKETEYSCIFGVLFMCCLAFVQKELPIKRYNVDIIGYDSLRDFVFAKFRAPLLLYFLQLLPPNLVCVYLTLVVLFSLSHEFVLHWYICRFIKQLCFQICLLVKLKFLGHDHELYWCRICCVVDFYLTERFLI
jgi:hypothetical protein